ncbi:hypothetical protein PMAC_002417 [Pneumocystis sp. 'macacae']|nr:hypothetical protein PMAC_002417 [Pneumocystis sp. 'macacae']
MSIYVNKNQNFVIQCQSIEQELIKSDSKTNENTSILKRMEELVRTKQEEIIYALQEIDGQTFKEDFWERDGIIGKTCVLQKGNVIEKSGVNVSVVRKSLSYDTIKKMRQNHECLTNLGKLLDFHVCGLSIVVHPHNPMAPSIHINYRYFEIEDKDGSAKIWWFGGGADLTPSYLFDEDATHFHSTYKEVCDRYDKEYYPKFKKWCDRYFYIKHRGETRGIGGIFFDDLDNKDPEELFSFIKDCIDAFLPSYIPILLRRKDMEYTPEEKYFQQIRRGRYVEFNMIYDRGTAFGLSIPNSRIESIFTALPLIASWEYQYVSEDPREKRLIEILKNPKEWI